MTRAATPKLGAYAGLAGAGLLAALVLGRPELAALAAPFALLLVVGLSLAETPRLSAFLELGTERQVEGEPVTASSSSAPSRRLPGSRCCSTFPRASSRRRPTRSCCALHACEGRELEHVIRCERWGAHLVGELVLRAQDRFGLLVVRADARPATSR